MRAWPILAALLLLLVSGPLIAADGGGLQYVPPVAPELPAIGPLLLRLLGATIAVLALCVGAMWLARRGLLGTAPPPAGNRLRLTATMPLGGGSFLYLLQAGDKQYVAGVNRTGLHSLVPLSEPFDQLIEDRTEE
jgi:flagellar biogenesis protein FliO